MEIKKSTRRDIGISYIGIEVPDYVVTSKTIADAMHVDEGKIKNGLLINQFRFPGYSDNFVTLAANNFIRFVENAYNTEELKEKIMKEGIGAVYFATETSREGSKPGSELVLELVEPVLYKMAQESEGGKKAFIEKILSDLPYADSLEAKFACTAEAKLLNLAIASIYSGNIRSAIVIGSDIALYDNEKATNAEETQGAASTLLYVTREPLLIKMDRKTAHYNLPSDDFYKSNEHTPHVPSGVGSEINYVVDIGSAFEAYEKRHGLPADFYIVSHVPFPKEAIYLSSFLLMHRLREENKIEEAEKHIGMKEPIGEEKSSLAFIRKAINEYYESDSKEGIAQYLEKRKDVQQLWEFHKLFRRSKFEPYERFMAERGIYYALKIPSEVGNSYNNSMWVATASLLLNAEKRKPIIFASYGSGSGTDVWKGEMLVDPGGELARKLVDIAPLKRSKELSADEYKELHYMLITKEEHEDDEDRIEKDKALLGNKFTERGFKLKGYDKRSRKGTYTYNGSEVRSAPVIISA